MIEEQERPEKSERKPFFTHEKTLFTGPVSGWVDWLVSSYNDLGLDTFIFWPGSEGDEESQFRTFAQQVVPKVKESLKGQKR